MFGLMNMNLLHGAWADSMSCWLTAYHVDCRDVVEQALPVLVRQQWSELQHHSLADKLQVSLLVAMLVHDGMLVKIWLLVGMSMLVGVLVGKSVLVGIPSLTLILGRHVNACQNINKCSTESLLAVCQAAYCFTAALSTLCHPVTALYCVLLPRGPAQQRLSQMLSTAPCLVIMKQCVPCHTIHFQACCVDSIFTGRVATRCCITSHAYSLFLQLWPSIIGQADYCITAAALLMQGGVHLKYTRPSLCSLVVSSLRLSASARPLSASPELTVFVMGVVRQ